MKHLVAITLALTLALGASAASAPAAAQGGAGFGIRAGTLGLGVDVAIPLGERVVARGGVGVNPIDPEVRFSEIDVTAELPTWYNVGLDLYLNGALRIGAGVLLKPSDPTLRGVFTQDQEIGGQTFTPDEIGTLTGVIDSRAQAPFVLIGFGNHTAAGAGLYVDFGVAFMGQPEFELDAIGGTLNTGPGAFRDALEREEQEFEDDAGAYLRFWPILNLGLRIGVG
jgi:hypothetical protein